MSNDLVTPFARIHADYRAAIDTIVRSLSPDDLNEAGHLYQAAVDPPTLTFMHLPDEVHPIAARVRRAVQREIIRRANAASQEQQA